MPGLDAKRVLITRPRDQADEFANLLREQGAIPILLPVIEIQSLADSSQLDRALRNLELYDWLILTSVNGVQAVWDRLAALGIVFPDPSRLSHLPRIAAIGPKTAGALERRGVVPDFVPETYVAEAIFPGLGDLGTRRVLLPRADSARTTLAELIQAAGGFPEQIVAYRTVPTPPDPEGLRALRQGVDILTFTSASTVRQFAELVGSIGLDPTMMPGNPVVACIGPITARAAVDAGLSVSIQAKDYTIEGLVHALLGYFADANKLQERRS